MKKYQINLLSGRKRSITFSEKFIYFIFRYLKYIVVLTQIVIISVFFYRFSIDQEVVDLKEIVGQKQEIIKSTFPLVNEAKAIESKSSEIKNLLSGQEQFVGNLHYIFSIVPEDIVVKTFSIDEKGIKIEGGANNFHIVKQFYEKLKKDKKFKQITLDKIAKTSSGFEYVISIII